MKSILVDNYTPNMVHEVPNMATIWRKCVSRTNPTSLAMTRNGMFSKNIPRQSHDRDWNVQATHFSRII